MPNGNVYELQFSNSAVYFTSTTNLTNSDYIWNNWQAGTATTPTVWTTWVSNGTITFNQPVQYPIETDEQRQAREARQAAWQAQYEAERPAREARAEEQRRRWAEIDEANAAASRMAAEEHAEAERKAKVILEENLTPEQRKQFADNSWFEVVTAKGTYRIRRGWSGNVDRYVNGRATDRYCIHPSVRVPHEDNMLAQKLMLESCEDEFLRIANRSTPPHA